MGFEVSRRGGSISEPRQRYGHDLVAVRGKDVFYFLVDPTVLPSTGYQYISGHTVPHVEA
ncbi:hypothetical protein D9M69_604020 [compost metagenome]